MILLLLPRVIYSSLISAHINLRLRPLPLLPIYYRLLMSTSGCAHCPSYQYTTGCSCQPPAAPTAHPTILPIYYRLLMSTSGCAHCPSYHPTNYYRLLTHQSTHINLRLRPLLLTHHSDTSFIYSSVLTSTSGFYRCPSYQYYQCYRLPTHIGCDS